MIRHNLAIAQKELAFFRDLNPDIGDFKSDAIAGLTARPKVISPKYFYDETGSKIFDKITALPEYYPTRTERALFLERGDEIAAALPARSGIFEYGSGSSEKIEWLLDRITDPVIYIAMDISRDHLLENASALAEALALPVGAICADFHAPIALPALNPAPEQWVGYFPGSTIGNMSPEAATQFFSRASETLGSNAKFLLGVDLIKDVRVLEAAYDDSEGVTAAFNINLLSRMKRELGAELNEGDFEHFSFFNENESRIEMHLRATRPTAIAIEDRIFSFDAGETLHTENSYKYTIEGIERLIEKTSWRLENVWTDPSAWYAACLFSNA